jgi:hypothetical protein
MQASSAWRSESPWLNGNRFMNEPTEKPRQDRGFLVEHREGDENRGWDQILHEVMNLQKWYDWE